MSPYGLRCTDGRTDGQKDNHDRKQMSLTGKTTTNYLWSYCSFSPRFLHSRFYTDVGDIDVKCEKNIFDNFAEVLTQINPLVLCYQQ